MPGAVLQQVTVIWRFVPYSSSDDPGQFFCDSQNAGR